MAVLEEVHVVGRFGVRARIGEDVGLGRAHARQRHRARRLDRRAARRRRRLAAHVKRAPRMSMPASAAAWQTPHRGAREASTGAACVRARARRRSNAATGAGSSKGANVGPGSGTPASALPERSARSTRRDSAGSSPGASSSIGVNQRTGGRPPFASSSGLVTAVPPGAPWCAWRQSRPPCAASATAC